MNVPNRMLLAAILVIGPAACSESNPGIPDGTIDTPADPAAEDVAAEVPDALDTSDPDASDPPPDDGFVDTIGRVCATAEDCQNGLYCDGQELCPYGFCTAGPLTDCGDGINCTLDTCNEETDACEHAVDDSACDDANPCTTDTCEVSTDTCVNAPVDCADTVNCTVDTCDTSTGDCVHTIADEACDDADACTIDTCDVSSDTCANTLIDGDGDLHPPESCGGDDCDDTEATIYTGATEVCDDGIDQDCDGSDEAPGACDCPVSVTVPGSYPGSNTGLGATHDGSCSYYTGGPEVIHRLDLTSAADVHFELSIVSYWSGVLYVRQATCTGTELDCVTVYDTGGFNLSLAAGTYYVFVDGDSTYDYGSYTLDLSTYVPPPNDNCPSATPITADGTLTGTTIFASNSTDPSTCASTSSGPDVWYRLDFTSTATVTFATLGSAFDTVLYVLSGSCTGSEVACDDDGGTGLDSLLTHTFSPGTYYLALDGYWTDDYGDYTLTITGMP